MSFKTLREQCLNNGYLFEDPDFPAVSRSIYYSKVDRNIVWRRPRELVQNPKFVVGGKSRFDLYQGSVGNCWYIAGVATIATKPELFLRVVPEDQGFGDDYAGIFRFYFWRFGQWIEVVIDDRLPTYRGRGLVFCQNRAEPNEFWSPLLEKAYAKVHQSYEALDGGWTEDALVDFTGGIGQRQDLKNKAEIPKGLFNRMLHDYSMNSLLGCSMQATKDTMENIQPNGLVIGHAYSLTKVTLVPDKQGNRHRLLRLRNPWGQTEWNGAWSDKSRTWLTVEDEIKSRIRVNDENGEFWISYEDWVNNFDEMQMCHLPPDNRMREKRIWKEVSHPNGEWVKGVSAGGCGNPPHRDLYWTNPQYSITLKDPDEDDDEKKCTLLVSLMQKYSRVKRSVYHAEFANVAMSFDLYKIRSHVNTVLDGESYSRRALQIARKGTSYLYYREITKEFKLEPGNYVVIPSLFEANKECGFILRLYTEHDADSVEIDIPTEPIKPPKSADDVIQDLFFKYAGDDRVVDARELQLILNEGYQKELGDEQMFELESCRSMMAMMDENKSGVLEWNELRLMWKELNLWRDTFKQFDKDDSGTVDIRELRTIFKSIGYSLSKRVLSSIVRRYGGKEGKLAFNDFIMVITKVNAHLKIFANHSKDGGLKGKAKFYLDDYMEVALYYG